MSICENRKSMFVSMLWKELREVPNISRSTELHLILVYKHTHTYIYINSIIHFNRGKNYAILLSEQMKCYNLLGLAC